MVLKVYDKNMTPLGLAEDSTSVTWTRRAREPSECDIAAPLTSGAAQLFEIGNILMKLEDETGEAMQIESRTVAMDEEGRETMTVRGRGLMAWLARRICLKSYNVEDDYTPQLIVYTLIEDNCLASGARALPIRLRYSESFFQDTVKFEAAEYADVLQLVEDQLDAGNMNLFVTTDPAAGTHTFELREAVDKTQTSASPVIIAVDFGTLAQPQITESREQYKNVCYIRGGDDDISAVETGDTAASGQDRFELGVSASDIVKTFKDAFGEEQTRTEAQVQTLLRQRGAVELRRACSDVRTFDGEIVQTDGLQYGRDYDVGDRVTCLYGTIRMDATITEITEEYSDGGKMRVTAVLSDGTFSMRKTLQLAAKRI